MEEERSQPTPAATHQDLRTGSRWRMITSWAFRITLGFVVLIVFLAGSGLIYQQAASWNDRGDFPPPGEMITVNGRDMHLLQVGIPHDGPSVVLLAAAGSMLSQWAWIQQDVGSFAHVVAYDRPGLGWSESSDRPRDARAAAEDLHALLGAAEIPGPYVLVGHSLGGAHARVFAEMYRDEVAGMVLIDAGNPDFWHKVDPDALKETRSTIDRMKLFPYLARFGVLRLLDPSSAIGADLPEAAREAANAWFATTRHATASRAEYQELLESSATMEQLRNLEPVGDLPLIVLTRTEPDDAYTGPQQEMDAELAETSTRGTHRLVSGADHFTIVTNEEYAKETTRAIRDVLSLVQSR